MLLDLFPRAGDYEDILELKALYALASGNEIFSANLPIDRMDEIMSNFSARMVEKGWKVYSRSQPTWTAPNFNYMEFKIEPEKE
jgi:hypothetical protein